MSGLRLTVSMVLVVLAPTAALAPGLQEQLENGIGEFRAGYQAWDAEKLSLAAATFEKACDASADAHLAHYWLGVTRFHILVHRQGDNNLPMDNREFNRLVRETRKPLKRAVHLCESDSEAHALLGTLAGIEIRRNPSKAFWLGRAVLRHRRLALEHGKTNPRTQYLLGAAHVQGPGFLGGPEKGLRYLRRADQLFEASASSNKEPAAWAPTWGHEHCLILIGQTYEHLGDVHKAQEYVLKALARNPENKLAQRRLDNLQQGIDGNEQSMRTKER